VLSTTQKFDVIGRGSGKFPRELSRQISEQTEVTSNISFTFFHETWLKKRKEKADDIDLAF
jgi:hypothetical protein